MESSDVTWDIYKLSEAVLVSLYCCAITAVKPEVKSKTLGSGFLHEKLSQSPHGRGGGDGSPVPSSHVTFGSLEDGQKEAWTRLWKPVPSPVSS